MGNMRQGESNRPSSLWAIFAIFLCHLGNFCIFGAPTTPTFDYEAAKNAPRLIFLTEGEGSHVNSHSSLDNPLDCHILDVSAARAVGLERGTGNTIGENAQRCAVFFPVRGCYGEPLLKLAFDDFEGLKGISVKAYKYCHSSCEDCYPSPTPTTTTERASFDEEYEGIT